jgi:hypothetical protein
MAEATKESATKPPINVGPFDILKTMIRIEHPDAMPSLVDVIKKIDSNKQGYYAYWIWYVIRGLPKTAVAPLEALLPTLREQTADQLLQCLAELKNNP